MLSLSLSGQVQSRDGGSCSHSCHTNTPQTDLQPVILKHAFCNPYATDPGGVQPATTPVKHCRARVVGRKSYLPCSDIQAVLGCRWSGHVPSSKSSAVHPGCNSCHVLWQYSTASAQSAGHGAVSWQSNRSADTTRKTISTHHLGSNGMQKDSSNQAYICKDRDQVLQQVVISQTLKGLAAQLHGNPGTIFLLESPLPGTHLRKVARGYCHHRK